MLKREKKWTVLTGESLYIYFFIFSIRQSADADSESPNIIILLADDLGYGDLGFSGHPTSFTPNLDNLAASSLHLTNFYVASPICSPSRASLLTGKYPVSTGIWPKVVQANSIGGLDPSHHTTLASRLSKVGYRTGHVGKWHLGIGENQQYLPTKYKSI